MMKHQSGSKSRWGAGISMCVLLTSVALTVAPRFVAADGDGGSFTSLTPLRVVNTRGSGVKVGDGSLTAAPHVLKVTDIAGVPDDVVAVALNVTVTQTESSGYVTVYPCDADPRPDASNLNFVANQTVPNAVIAPVSADGTVCFFVKGTAHLLADISGYFSSGFSALTPTRVVNTRSSGVKVGDGSLTAAPHVLNVTDIAGVPSDVGAVALNVTVTQTESSGYVTVYPCDADPRPDASNLNFVANQTVPNAVIAPVSADGTVCFFVKGKAHLLADISGYFSSGFSALTPTRVVNTRSSGVKVGDGSLTAAPHVLNVTDVAGVPSDVGAVALNVTVTQTESSGYVTVYPCDASPRPDASNLNFVAGQTVPNAVIAPVSADGTVCFFVKGKAHLLADISGYFSSDGGSSDNALRYLATAERLAPATRVGSRVLDVEQQVLVGVNAAGEMSNVTIDETGETVASDAQQELVVEHMWDGPGSAVVLLLSRSVDIDGESCYFLYLESDTNARCIDASVTQIAEKSFTEKPAYNPMVQFDDDGRMWFASFGVNGNFLKQWDPITGEIKIIVQNSDFTGDNALDPGNAGAFNVFNFVAFSDAEAARFGAAAMMFGTADRCVDDEVGTGGTLPNGDHVDDCYAYQWMFARVKSVGNGVDATVLQLDDVDNAPAFIRVFEDELYTTFENSARWGIYAYNSETDEFSVRVLGDSRTTEPVPDACADDFEAWAVCMGPQQAWGYFEFDAADDQPNDVVSVSIGADTEQHWQFNRLVPTSYGRDGVVSVVSASVTYELSENRTQGVIRRGDAGIFIAGQTSEGDSVLAVYDPVTNTEEVLVGPDVTVQSAKVDVYFEVTSMTQDGNRLVVAANVFGSEVIGSIDLTTGELTLVDLNPNFTNIDNLTNFAADGGTDTNQ